MLRSTALSNAPDALHLAGALVLLLRALEQYMRSAAAGDTLTLMQLGLLGQIEPGIDRPSRWRVLSVSTGRVSPM